MRKRMPPPLATVCARRDGAWCSVKTFALLTMRWRRRGKSGKVFKRRRRGHEHHPRPHAQPLSGVVHGSARCADRRRGGQVHVHPVSSVGGGLQDSGCLGSAVGDRGQHGGDALTIATHWVCGCGCIYVARPRAGLCYRCKVRLREVAYGIRCANGCINHYPVRVGGKCRFCGAELDRRAA